VLGEGPPLVSVAWAFQQEMFYSFLVYPAHWASGVVDFPGSFEVTIEWEVRKSDLCDPTGFRP
jgi:hypothetical protein